MSANSALAVASPNVLGACVPFKKQDDQAQRINNLLAGAEPRLRRKFQELIDALTDENTLEELAELLSTGQFNRALANLELHAGKFANEVVSILILSGEDSADLLEDVLEIVVSFDQTNVRAVNLMRTSRLRLIREFTQEQVAATQLALSQGISQGLNPIVQARLFKDSIGLTRKQVLAVENYKRLLIENSAEALTRKLRDRRFDSTVRRAIRSGTPLSASQIDKMVSRYRERFLKFRAETIARTESLSAVHEGYDEMFRQAFDFGQLDPDALIREWITAADERVRSSHAAMHGQRRRINEPFVSGNGVLLMRPGDPNAPASERIRCRCALTTRLKEL